MASLIKLTDWQPGPLVNVVFVHGLGGHPFDTWRLGRSDAASDPTFWPLWLGRDVVGAVVYTLGYEAAASGWLGQAMPFEDRTRNLAELLVMENFAPDVPVILIGHSLGGLFIKSILLLMEEEDSRPEFAQMLQRVSGVIFLGTPHTGAGKASLLDWLRALAWPSPLTRALVADAPALRRINTSYRRFAQARGARLRHRVLFETRATLLGQIVSEGSADPGLNDAAPVGIDADHFGVAKPSDRQSLAYRIILDFVRDVVPSASDLTPVVRDMPVYRSGSPVNWPGALGRIGGLGALVAAVVIFWPVRNPADQLVDDPQKLVQVLSVIEDPEHRLEAAELFFRRPLTPMEKAFVEAIDYTPPAADQVPATARARIETATSREDLLDAVVGVSLKACSGNFAFKVNGPYLTCADGTPVPVIRTPNVGAPLKSLEALIFHFTASASFEGDLRFLTDASRDASYHLIVSRGGAMVQLVPFDHQALHAGASAWPERNLTSLNRYSVGISFSNAGKLSRDADGTYRDGYKKPVPSDEVATVEEGVVPTYWQSYSEDQIQIARALVVAFRDVKPDIGLLAHSDVAARKTDPGPVFPLEELRRAP